MDSIIGAVTIFGLVTCVLLAFVVRFRAVGVRGDRTQAALLFILAALLFGARLLPSDAPIGGQSLRALLSLALLPALLACFGSVVLRDIHQRRQRVWLMLNAVWFVVLAIAIFSSPALSVGSSEWLISLFTTLTFASAVILGGFVIIGGYLLVTAFYAFYRAGMPEAANRALYWALDTGLLLIGLLLFISGTPALSLVGALLLLVAVGAIAYALLSHRVVDIRSEIGAGTRTFALALIVAAITYLAIRLSRNLETDNERAALVYATLALAVGLIAVPIQRFVDAAMRQMMSDPQREAISAARGYSQAVAGALDVEQLAQVAAQSLNTALRLRRAGLMLIEHHEGEPAAEATMKFGDGREAKSFVSSSGAFYRTLTNGREPITQFDVEFSPTFQELLDEERRFLRDLNVSAYAPILLDDELAGVLIAGPKVNDAPFYSHDLDALASMASQTAVALRNLRLASQLNNVSGEVGGVSQQIEDLKAQIVRLDAVKSEFVTIASHELRTPLAQIRGYIDILDALNQGNALDQDQTTGMVLNLRKATERMEELISAMLDTSQLDTGAMELHFTQTAMESLMRLAIEPLTDPIKQRRLTLSARGLRSLPTTYADVPRLVQAVRNVILNAVKFTPDGGRIDVTAAVQPAQRPGARDQVLVTVADSGVGIDHENLELIFQKFYRAYDPVLHSTGTTKFMGAGPGLGLTIARGIIERHGGKIWAESPGHDMETYPGATFYILLPVANEEDVKDNGDLQFDKQATNENSAVRSPS